MPLFTSLFGFLILGEKITTSEILCLILAFYGVYTLLYSGSEALENYPADEAESNITMWPLLMALLGPMLMATTNICLRHMRGLHEYTASAYSVIFSVVVFGTLIPTSGQHITVTSTFVSWEFVLFVFVSLAGGFGMIFKTKAMQYEMAARLGMLAYLSIIFTFLFDHFLIGTVFNSGEI